METIRPTPWKSGQLGPLEVIRRHELFARFPVEHFDQVERLEFHLAMLITSGRGQHEIDFVDIEIESGHVVYIEPGQVHRWHASSQFDATLALFRSPPSGLAAPWRLGPTYFELAPSEHDEAERILAMAEASALGDLRDQERMVTLRAIRDLLYVRMGLSDDRTVADGPLPDAYVALRVDLESDLQVTTTMEQRAHRLGYSARTISRACSDVAGRTAKELVDERLVLEAKRRLSQPNTTIAQVAAALGFSEQTNFAKYFRRHVGAAPSAWMASL